MLVEEKSCRFARLRLVNSLGIYIEWSKCLALLLNIYSLSKSLIIFYFFFQKYPNLNHHLKKVF